MKDEGLIPTGTFKARGAAVGVSRAAELGVSAIAMPTNGNAGAAWSVYAARAGMRSLVVMPEAAPAITRAECAAAGAELYLVDGLIGDAGKLVAAAVARRPGYQDTSTLREPYRIEGKKTMGLEIAEQLGWRLPGVIVYPTGGGVGIIGIYKALRELLELGWVSGDLPRLVAVQAAGCAPIVRAFQAGATASEPWPDAKTVAFGITVPNALGDFLILEALYATGGTAVAVTDEALLADQRTVARLEGSFICPEGAACVTAVRQLRESGWLSEHGRGRRAQHRHRADLPGHRAGHRARAPAVRLDSPRARADDARLGSGRDHPRQGRDQSALDRTWMSMPDGSTSARSPGFRRSWIAVGIPRGRARRAARGSHARLPSPRPAGKHGSRRPWTTGGGTSTSGRRSRPRG